MGNSRKKPYRVCFWSTTFQSDIHSFARYLDSHPDYEIMVALDGPDSFQEEGVQKLLPINSPFLDKHSRLPIAIPFLNKHSLTTLLRVKLFRPDALVTDNHFPPIRLAKKLLVLWHGFGWRMDNLSGEFEHVHNNIERLFGSDIHPNPNFIWQCYGTGDMKYRHEVSKFPNENLRVFGSAQSDDIRNVMIPKEKIAPYYPIDIMARPTVLLGFTWHHGKVLSHWGEDMELYRDLFAFSEELGINLILRMHDSFRYEDAYVKELEDLVQGYDHVMLKFKNFYQDTLMDLFISDIMVSNYSSIINRFYLTGKPSIHVYPVRKGDEKTTWRRLGDDGQLVEEEVKDELYAWKFPPEMIGGLMVNTMDELKDAIRRSLVEPDCCKKKSEEFVDLHMGGSDGHACERIEKELRSLIQV